MDRGFGERGRGGGVLISCIEHSPSHANAGTERGEVEGLCLHAKAYLPQRTVKGRVRGLDKRGREQTNKQTNKQTNHRFCSCVCRFLFGFPFRFLAVAFEQQERQGSHAGVGPDRAHRRGHEDVRGGGADVAPGGGTLRVPRRGVPGGARVHPRSPQGKLGLVRSW